LNNADRRDALRDIAQHWVRIQRCLGIEPRGPITRTGKTSNSCLDKVIGDEINPSPHEGPLAFKTNYGSNRAERDRAARAKNKEKLRKKDEKTAVRKALRAADPAPPEEKQD
jgi:hypothetical protein